MKLALVLLAVVVAVVFVVYERRRQLKAFEQKEADRIGAGFKRMKTAVNEEKQDVVDELRKRGL